MREILEEYARGADLNDLEEEFDLPKKQVGAIVSKTSRLPARHRCLLAPGRPAKLAAKTKARQ